jgi:methyltransferase
MDVALHHKEPSTALPYLALIALVGIGRVLELRISRRHLETLASAGASPLAERAFSWMVMLHVAALVAAPLEVLLLRRRAALPLSIASGATFVGANLLRWWSIRSLSTRWSVRVVDALPLGVSTGGPYRWIRHPNYVAVAVELAALPLIHGAWLTALAASFANAAVLSRRIVREEAVLFADPTYARAMGHKPRFLPWPTS